METTTMFFIIAGIIGIAVLGYVMKLRGMPQYKISKETDENDGKEKWFVKVRKGLSYYYLEQTLDPPGFENDKFATHTHQAAGHETELLAEKIIINHRMTTVNGIEVEGE
jgi:hypothetical protein